MTCRGGDCPPWCECVNETCQPLPLQINALRLRTRDGRYLHAKGGGTFGVVWVSTVVPEQWETFRLATPPTPHYVQDTKIWPLVSGDLIALEVCDANWGPSGYLIRVDANPIPSGELIRWEFGGPDTDVRVSSSCISRPGCAGWEGEYVFVIEKVGGGPIATGDEISLVTENGYYFRITGAQNDASIMGDGTLPGQADTVFVVEFNQVMVGLGWRPTLVQCQTCGVVSGTVTSASTGQPVAGATVEIQGTNFKATTRADGRFTLVDPDGRDCVPEGRQTARTSANFHQPRTDLVTVTAGGNVDMVIQLDCTNVRGKVIDATTNQPVSGVVVYLTESDGDPVGRPDGSLIEATTVADGTFVIRCVPHGNWGVWTDGASTTPITVPPEGIADVVIILGCGDVVGTVIDANTFQPIQGARVKRFGSSPGEDEATTDATGNFRIQCVSPAGVKSLRTNAPGYLTGTNQVDVPASGSSTPIDIRLRPIPVTNEITIVLSWGTQPNDLDSHLSGPNSQGGRFHLFYSNLTSPPVDFANLDLDDTTTQGPETVTIHRSPSVGMFIAGEYRYWVHNYNQSTFAGSNAVVTVFQNSVQLGQFAAGTGSTTGNPTDGIWHVVNLQIDTNGMVVLNTIQTFQQGDSNTIL